MLDILCCVTEHKFYCSKHQINITRIAGRTYDTKKGSVKIDDPKQDYNTLSPSPAFNGQPYDSSLKITNNEGDRNVCIILLAYPITHNICNTK